MHKPKEIINVKINSISGRKNKDANAKNMCQYLDMPIQHASNKILKSMRRGLGQSGIRDRILQLREAIPNIRIRTTLIVGYPDSIL